MFLLPWTTPVLCLIRCVFWILALQCWYIRMYTQPMPLHLPHVICFMHIQLWPISESLATLWSIFNVFIFTPFHLHITSHTQLHLNCTANPQLPCWLVEGVDSTQQHTSQTPRLLLLPAPLVPATLYLCNTQFFCMDFQLLYPDDGGTTALQNIRNNVLNDTL